VHASATGSTPKRPALGLVTFAPDDIDWDEEVRIAIEERTAFAGRAHRIGGEPALRRRRNHGNAHLRPLSAWQNWIFNRPNAVGEQGALKVFEPVASEVQLGKGVNE